MLAMLEGFLLQRNYKGEDDFYVIFRNYMTNNSITVEYCVILKQLFFFNLDVFEVQFLIYDNFNDYL